MTELNMTFEEAIITDEKKLNTFVKRAVNGYNKARINLHIAAISCMNHAKTTGDTRPLKNLFESMGTRSQTRHRIAASIREHSQYKDEDGKTKLALVANITKDGKVVVKLGDIPVREHINVKKAFNNPYWDTVEVQQTKAPFELSKAAAQFIAKAVKEGASPADVRVAVEEALIKSTEKAA